MARSYNKLFVPQRFADLRVIQLLDTLAFVQPHHLDIEFSVPVQLLDDCRHGPNSLLPAFLTRLHDKWTPKIVPYPS